MINKRGSSTLLLAMITVAVSAALLSSIWIIRNWVVKSESEVFGRVWTRAILSEYDRHLLEDYHLLGFHGSDAEVVQKLQLYMDYSMAGRLHADIRGIDADLTGYALQDPANFRRALRQGFASDRIDSWLRENTRKKRPDAGAGKEEVREIRNPVVIETLPSKGMAGSVDAGDITETLKEGGYINAFKERGAGLTTETLFIRKYMNSHASVADSGKHFYRNEMEYIIRGSLNDDTNYEACRRRLFLIRNALNLLYLYSDSTRVEAVTGLAEILTPGPIAAVTQTILMEAWAAIETEADLRDLQEGKRIPVLKNASSWHTDMGALVTSEEAWEQLDEDVREQLLEQKDTIPEELMHSTFRVVREGLTYEDYLTVMILAMDENVRLLRIMDLVQINMKYRYYEDFDLAEYYGGVYFAYQVNGQEYSFEEAYR